LKKRLNSNHSRQKPFFGAICLNNPVSHEFKLVWFALADDVICSPPVAAQRMPDFEKSKVNAPGNARRMQACGLT